jgi:RNA polymerase sigma-70 factor, ECF subfamily
MSQHASPSHSQRAQFERSILAHQRTLRRSALQLSRSAADADDLVQETMVRAWRFWPRYTESDNSRAWLQRILRNTFLSRCRRASREREVMQLLPGEPARPTGLAPELEAAGLDDGLEAALQRLRSEQRAVLWLVDVQERSYREAADELGLPIGTVMSRLHRARLALREAFLGVAGAPGMALQPA